MLKILKIFKLVTFKLFISKILFCLSIFCLLTFFISIFDFTGCFHVYAETAQPSSSNPSSNNFWYKVIGVSLLAALGVGFMYYNGFGPFSSASSVSSQPISTAVENTVTNVVTDTVTNVVTDTVTNVVTNTVTNVVTNTVVSAPPPASLLPKFVEILGPNISNYVVKLPYDQFIYNYSYTITMYQSGRMEFFIQAYPIHPEFYYTFLDFYCKTLGFF